MKFTEQLNELASAMALAQGQFTAAERDYTAKVTTRKGSDYQFNYADLAAYLDVCRGPLSDNGIAVFQEPVSDGRKARVTTLIVHKSGQWIQFDPLELEVAFKEQGEMPTPQEMGSLITYARRYSQSAALNMASEQDDDANQASGNTASTGKRAPKPACPKCHRADFVYEDKNKGGWFCWKKPEQGKHGCGHNWLPAAEAPPAEDPFGNPVVDDLKKQGKLTTADKLPPKKVQGDPEGNFDPIGYYKKKFAIENTDEGLDAALKELKANKEAVGGEYKPLLIEWFNRAVEVAGNNERLRALDGLLAKAKEAVGEDAFVKIGAAIDRKYKHEAAAV